MELVVFDIPNVNVRPSRAVRHELAESPIGETVAEDRKLFRELSLAGPGSTTLI